MGEELTVERGLGLTSGGKVLHLVQTTEVAAGHLSVPYSCSASAQGVALVLTQP